MPTRLVLALVACLVLPGAVHGDTLIVVGVVVTKDGARVGGARVRLLPTSNPVGRELASDSTSDRGLFTLVRLNVSGALGDLYVVYDGADGVAVPLKATLEPGGGLMKGRTADLIVLPTTHMASHSPAEVAERLEALAATEQVLVQAQVKDEQSARLAVNRQTLALIQATASSKAEIAQIKQLTSDRAFKSGWADRGIHVAVRDSIDRAHAQAPQ